MLARHHFVSILFEAGCEDLFRLVDLVAVSYGYGLADPEIAPGASLIVCIGVTNALVMCVEVLVDIISPLRLFLDVLVQPEIDVRRLTSRGNGRLGGPLAVETLR